MEGKPSPRDLDHGFIESQQDFSTDPDAPRIQVPRAAPCWRPRQQRGHSTQAHRPGSPACMEARKYHDDHGKHA
jgi:hypothetical protein